MTEGPVSAHVKVRRLRWRDDPAPQQPYIAAMTAFKLRGSDRHLYTIMRDGQLFNVFYGTTRIDMDSLTLAAAKAVAQADWQALVTKAIKS